MIDEHEPLIAKEFARALGIATRDWATLGLDPSESYALCTDPQEPLSSLVAYYDTEALAIAAAGTADAATPGGRYTLLVNPLG